MLSMFGSISLYTLYEFVNAWMCINSNMTECLHEKNENISTNHAHLMFIISWENHVLWMTFQVVSIAYYS